MCARARAQASEAMAVNPDPASAASHCTTPCVSRKRNTERLCPDPCVGITDLQEALESFFKFIGSRDLNAYLQPFTASGKGWKSVPQDYMQILTHM